MMKIAIMALFFEKVLHVATVGLELDMQTRLVSNLPQSSWLFCLLSAGITGEYQHNSLL